MHQCISRMLVVFCKPILAILLQRTRLIARMHLSVVFCKPILALLLQRKRLIDRMHLAWWLFCNIVTKKHQTIINASRVLVVFCKPILAILLQRKLQTIDHHAFRMIVPCGEQKLRDSSPLLNEEEEHT